MKSFPILIGLSATTLATPSVHAQTTPTPEQKERARDMFVSADTDKSGALDMAEWKAAGRRERGFSYIDTDKNGEITPDELREAVAKRR